MNVGYFIAKFPYAQQVKDYLYGGSILAAYHLVLEMVKLNNNVTVFTTASKKHTTKEVTQNLTVLRFGTTFRILTANISLQAFAGPLENDVDIVHTHFDIPPHPFASLRYAKKKDVPLVVTYHGDWGENYGGAFRETSIALLNKFAVNALLSRADVIISPSDLYIEKSRFLPKYSDKVVTIPNGTTIQDYRIGLSKEECRSCLGLPLDKRIILFLGYLSPYKGPEILVRALSHIVKDVPEAVVVFAGTGVMRAELRDLAYKLGIRDQIIFTGFIEDRLKPLYYKAADVFILPSTMETECFPLTVLEAMASGAPIVASNIGGIPDAIQNGKNGVLVEPNNVEALSDAIIRVLQDETHTLKMVETARKDVIQYSWEHIAERTIEVYRGVLA